MRNTITAIMATVSTAVPEIVNKVDQINPEMITEGSSLVVQILTAIIALISFFKGMKKKPIVKEITYKEK